jgi:Glycosyl transferase family 11
MSLSVYLSAGLGNRLFQYASVKGLATKYNLNFKIYAIDVNHEHNFNNYDWFISRMIQDSTECLQIPRHIITSAEFAKQQPNIKLWNQPQSEHIGYFEPKDIQNLQNHVLYGYFQSELYFENIADKIREDFKEPEFIKPVLNNYLEVLKRQNIRIEDCCIIHVRLKDKLNDPRHFVNYTKYYRRAIVEVRKLKPKAYFLVLSETPNDIQYVYPTLLSELGTKDINYSIVPRTYENLEIFDLYLLTRISTIICSCSTFVWWGAWLNPLLFPEKQVYLPSRFTNDATNNRVEMKGAKIIDVD